MKIGLQPVGDIACPVAHKAAELHIGKVVTTIAAPGRQRANGNAQGMSGMLWCHEVSAMRCAAVWMHLRLRRTVCDYAVKIGIEVFTIGDFPNS